jgi:hypothetical protein
MLTERQMQKAIEFCTATMHRYQAGRRMRHASIEMIAETQAHASWILNFAGQSPSDTDHILRSVEDELVSRYGRDVGGRLTSEFLQAFDSFSTSLLNASMQDGVRFAPDEKAAYFPISREHSHPNELESQP